MKLFKSIVAFVARICGNTSKLMANADPDPTKADTTHRDMLLKLLGLPTDANPEMVNERFKKAMECDADEDDKKAADMMKAKDEEVKAVNEKLTLAASALKESETLMANEKSAKEAASAKAKQTEADLATAKQTIKSVETMFANERAERVKLILAEGIRSSKITLAESKVFETEFANSTDFDATLKKLGEKKGTLLPNTRQAANIGARKPHFTPEGKARQDSITEMVNEEGKKACYRHLPEGARYSQAFTAVMAAHPELRPTETK
jgi:hypothetical protein